MTGGVVVPLHSSVVLIKNDVETTLVITELVSSQYSDDELVTTMSEVTVHSVLLMSMSDVEDG